MKKIGISFGALCLLLCGQAFSQTQQGIDLALHSMNASQQQHEAVLVNSAADININAVVSTVTLTQTFENPSADWVEAVYTFPLPDNAAVDKMTLTLDGKRIVGSIRKKQVANELYQAAVDNGQQAALLSASRDNLFTVSAGNIAPYSRIAIELHYVQPTAYDAGEFSLHLPTTYTPRYQASSQYHEATCQADNTALPAAVFDQQSINLLALNISLDAGAMMTELTSSSHETVQTIHADGKTADITTVGQGIAMDKDFRLNWRIVDTGQPMTLAFTEQTDSGYYTSLMFVPSLMTEKSTMPREIILIIDTSGSMEGAAMREAKAGALAALAYLNTNDYLNLIEFNNQYSQLFTESQLATADTIAQASDFIRGLTAGGGTEMKGPLNEALSAPQDSGLFRQVIFLTDGAVSNESDLFGLIKRQLGQSRLFTVGIGAAPNHFFMRQAARAGRGSFTTIADNDAVMPAMQRLFEQLQRPSLTDIDIALPDAGVVQRYPNPISDVYWGQPIVAAIKSDLPPMSLSVEALLDGMPWQADLPPLAFASALMPTAESGLSQLWAKEKINALTEEAILWGNNSMNDEAITQLGLDYQLVTPHTAFVAIEEVIRRDPLMAPLLSQHVANQPPAGMGFPQTATNSTLTALLALLLLAVAAVLFYSERKKKCLI